MTKKTTNRTAKVTASANKASFRTKKTACQKSFDTEGQFEILEIARQIKAAATDYDEHGDALWRWADKIGQIIEARG